MVTDFRASASYTTSLTRLSLGGLPLASNSTVAFPLPFLLLLLLDGAIVVSLGCARFS